MTCSQWKDGKCSLGLYGGKPKSDQCARCTEYDGPSRGLGDMIWAAMEAAKVHRIMGRCEGCAKRRAMLNRKDGTA